MSAEDVGKAFVAHWYQTRGNDPNQLAALFQPHSMLTFEGKQFQGPQPIIAELIKVGRATYKTLSVDIQPSTDPSSMLIFCTGTVTVGENPLHFAETFQLCSTSPGQYYVHNCIFRLNYGQ